MSDLKTQPTGASVADFLAGVEPASRRTDAQTLATLLAEVTGEAPVMWGTSIVGFGRYTYVNTTKKPADWPIIGFSPRKANLTVYITPGFDGYEDLLARLGKHRTSVSCLYLNRLSDVDLDVLREMATRSVAWMRARYPSAG